MDSAFTNNIGFWLNHTTTALRMELEEEAKKIGFKAQEALVIMIAGADSGVPLVKIAERMSNSHPSVLRHIDALEKRGYIYRAPHPDDRRIKLLTLTEKGAKIRPEVIKIILKIKTKAETGMSADELNTLIDLLQRVHTSFRSQEETDHLAGMIKSISKSMNNVKTETDNEYY